VSEVRQSEIAVDSEKRFSKHHQRESDIPPVGWLAYNLATLSAVFTALSLLALLKFALGVGFAPALEKTLDAYNSITKVALGWATPYLSAFVDPISRLLDVQLKVYPHWKHIFVVLMILVGAVFKVTQDRRVGTSLRSKLALYAAAVFLTALCSAVVGSVNRDVAGELGDIFIASFPIAIIVSMLVLLNYISRALERAERGASTDYAENALRVLLPGLPTVALSLLVGYFVAHCVSWIIFAFTAARQTESPGVVVLGAWIVMIAVFFLCSGLMQGSKAFRRKYTEKTTEGNYRFIKKYGAGAVVKEIFLFQLISRPVLMSKFGRICWGFKETQFAVFVLFSFFSAGFLAAASAGQEIIGSN
jgi:hypothetical protein